MRGGGCKRFGRLRGVLGWMAHIGGGSSQRVREDLSGWYVASGKVVVVVYISYVCLGYMKRVHY